MTPRSFRFLPAAPLAGRVFTPGDGAPGAEPVVLVRESLWRRRFGASASIAFCTRPKVRITSERGRLDASRRARVSLS